MGTTHHQSYLEEETVLAQPALLGWPFVDWQAVDLIYYKQPNGIRKRGIDMGETLSGGRSLERLGEQTSPPSQPTLLLIKPDAMRRGLSLEIQRMVRASGLMITETRAYEPNPPRYLIEAHYHEHAGRPYFQALVDFMVSGPVVAHRVEGVNAIARLRELIGDKTYNLAKPGTIRRDLGDPNATPQETVVHGSDKPEAAVYELSIWFKKDQEEHPLAEELRTGHA